MYEEALPCVFLCLVEESFWEALREVRNPSCLADDGIGEHWSVSVIVVS